MCSQRPSAHPKVKKKKGTCNKRESPNDDAVHSVMLLNFPKYVGNYNPTVFHCNSLECIKKSNHTWLASLVKCPQ